MNGNNNNVQIGCRAIFHILKKNNFCEIKNVVHSNKIKNSAISMALNTKYSFRE